MNLNFKKYFVKLTAFIGGSNDCKCKDTLQPICGKDGVTYDNLCRLTCAKVKPDYFGSCKAPSADCICTQEV